MTCFDRLRDSIRGGIVGFVCLLKLRSRFVCSTAVLVLLLTSAGGVVSSAQTESEKSSPTVIASPAESNEPDNASIAALKLKLPRFQSFVATDSALSGKTDPNEFDLELEEKSIRKYEHRFNDRLIDPTKSQTNGKQKFHWTPAMWQSLVFLGIQHGFRMTEEKTRAGLDGPFFSDWRQSVANLEGWDDGGKWFTNYIAHPWQGAITSRIFINNSEHAMAQQFSKKKEYWTSRLKSMAWSAVWSAQFEIGPISEASLGNVGLERHADGRSKLTYIDFVITPVLGTAWAVVEDAIERYVIIEWAEKKFKNRVWIKFLRTVLTPTTSFANITRFKAFWWRPRKLT